jgi:hypothetical protein
MVVKTGIACLVLVPTLAACAVDHPPEAGALADETSVSQGEVATAEAVARRVIAEQGASVSSASVIARTASTGGSNTGHPCTSGRELQIQLIGDFPHTVTTGHPVPPGSPAPDVTVRAMNITADAESGLECLIGVQTGEIEPLSGATRLSIP